MANILQFNAAQPEQTGPVVNIPLIQLCPFPHHPFTVRNDDSMDELVESIKAYGVLNPIIARPYKDCTFQIISGHRRKYASEIVGLDMIPAIIRELDDDMATILLVDSNLQREKILPSERAWAFRLKLEAIKRRAGRPTRIDIEKSVQCEYNYIGKRSIQLIAEENGASQAQVRRFIRLTYLLPELLALVDSNKIGLTPAVELSYLRPKEQSFVLETIDSEQATPSFSQAQRIRRLSETGLITEDLVLKIMSERKKPEGTSVVIHDNVLRQFFPSSYTPRQMEVTIIKLLKAWKKRYHPN